MEKKKTFITFIYVFIGILLTNAISYVINNLEPNTFVKKHAFLLLLILSAVLAAFTVVISNEEKVLTGIRSKFTFNWVTVMHAFSSTILFFVLFSIFIVGPFLFYGEYQYSNDMMINDPQTEVRLTQKYCNALERQDYALAYSYGDSLSIQTSNRDISSKAAYIEKARLADRNGRVKSCVVKKETQISDDSAYSISTLTAYLAYDYLLEVEIIREKQSPYLIHLTMHVSGAFPSGYIKGIDKL